MCILGWVVLSLNIQDALILEGLGSQQFISSFLSYFSVRGIPDGSQWVYSRQMFWDRSFVHLLTPAPGGARSLLRLAPGGHHPQPPAHYPGERRQPCDNNNTLMTYQRTLILSRDLHKTIRVLWIDTKYPVIPCDKTRLNRKSYPLHLIFDQQYCCCPTVKYCPHINTSTRKNLSGFFLIMICVHLCENVCPFFRRRRN